MDDDQLLTNFFKDIDYKLVLGLFGLSVLVSIHTRHRAFAFVGFALFVVFIWYKIIQTAPKD